MDISFINKEGKENRIMKSNCKLCQTFNFKGVGIKFEFGKARICLPGTNRKYIEDFKFCPECGKELTKEDFTTKPRERHVVKVIFANGNSMNTWFNGTVEEIKDFYIGNIFNLGVVEDDLQKAIDVEFLN